MTLFDAYGKPIQKPSKFVTPKWAIDLALKSFKEDLERSRQWQAEYRICQLRESAKR